MWILLTLGSALLLGSYDVAKKFALRRNNVYYVLLVTTALSALFLCPFLKSATPEQHLKLVLKAALVTASWVSGMVALKLLPITTVSTLKASRPMFVVLFSVLLLGESLSLLQWLGVILVFVSIWLLSRESSREGIKFSSNKGVIALAISIFAGVASALFDKHIVDGTPPFFVQSWTSLYVTIMLGAIVLTKIALRKGPVEKFRPDWTLLVIAVFISLADALYFFALVDSNSMLSIVSVIRRCSVLVSFCLGAILFKEKQLAGKLLALLIMLAGIITLLIASV